MSEKIILVTAPDDMASDGMRLILVNLSRQQRNLLSAELVKIDVLFNVIVYLWNSSEDINWLLDKTRKCSLIIFNADFPTYTINGYLAAQINSYYFGNLQDISAANQNKITDIADLLQIFSNQYYRLRVDFTKVLLL